MKPQGFLSAIPRTGTLQASDTSPATQPELSIVLPVRNEADHVLLVLNDLVAQDLASHRYEILVVDGGSEDATVELVEEYGLNHQQVRLLTNPARLSSAARNVGIENALGRYVLFVDGHCRVRSTRMLADALSAFESGASCLSRPQPLLAGSRSRTARAVVLTRSSLLGHLPGSLIYEHDDLLVDPTSAGCAYSMELIARVGLFDENFDAAEDVEFNSRVHRAGVQARHSARFAVDYVARSNWPDLARQMHRYGLGRARLIQVYPRSLGTFLAAGPGVLLLLTTILLALLPFFPVVRMPLVALSTAMALASTACVIAVGRQSDALTALLAAPAFVAIMTGAATGFITGVFRSWTGWRPAG